MSTLIKKTILALAVLLICSLGSCFAQTQTPEHYQRIDKIVAVVNNEVIAQSDIERVLSTIEAEYKTTYSNPQELNQQLDQAKKNIISQMIEEKLILSAAKKIGIRVDEDKVNQRIELLSKRFPSEQEFEQALLSQELTLSDLRNRFFEQEIMRNAVDYFVRAEIKIDLPEIKDFYQEHRDEFCHPEAARVNSIFIKVEGTEDEYASLQQAKSILERLQRGEGFAALGSQELGLIQQGQLIEEIERVIFALAPGEFSGVIKVPEGYRIFQIVEKIPAVPLNFAQAQEKIRQILYRQKFETRFKQWMEKLKAEADISIK
ncbi:MAG: peptidyl-prolyl cis-trans isomerase [Candidatus Omnitrophica bacterium]|nr:peptidyl-prolyl cis-trans isomerase [Candidatus Omnitrophota bacterium]